MFLNVYPNGAKITTNSEGISAIITAIIIRENVAIYECSYFFNGEYRICTLGEKEFKTESSKSIKIGFKLK